MEADVLRWSLLGIGSVVIVGLAIHGIWVSRKNNEKKSAHAQSRKNQQQYESAEPHTSDDLYDENIADDMYSGDQSFSVKKDPIVDDYDIQFDTVESEISEKTGLVAEDSENPAEFDDLGLGAVRVVSATEQTEPKTSNKVPAENEPPKTDTNQTSKIVKTSDTKIYASVVTQPKPEYAAKYQSLAAETVAITQQERVNSTQSHSLPKSTSAEFGANTSQNFAANSHYQAPEPPPFLLKKQSSEQLDTQPLAAESIPMDETSKQKERSASVASEQPSDTANLSATASATASATSSATAAEAPAVLTPEKFSLSEQARNLVKRKKSESNKKRQEPKIAEDQMRIDFDDTPVPKDETASESGSKNSKSNQQASPQPQQEVLVLNVKVAEGENIAGAALLPMLLTLGFKFGEQDIFHRHVNSNGKGPVLFSLANMFKPGNFDIDNLENFTTQGISLFMILPIEGEPHQVFNMMHNAARKIADEFSGQIYDGRRALLTKQSLQQYVEKIREFERQRMLKR